MLLLKISARIAKSAVQRLKHIFFVRREKVPRTVSWVNMCFCGELVNRILKRGVASRQGTKVPFATLVARIGEFLRPVLEISLDI